MADDATSPEQIDYDAAERWLQEHWPERVCPLCGYSDWTYMRPLDLAVRARQDAEWAGALFPVLPIMCTRCGGVQFFGAHRIGALPSDRVPANDPPEPAAENTARERRKTRPRGLRW